MAPSPKVTLFVFAVPVVPLRLAQTVNVSEVSFVIVRAEVLNENVPEPLRPAEPLTPPVPTITVFPLASRS